VTLGDVCDFLKFMGTPRPAEEAEDEGAAKARARIESLNDKALTSYIAFLQRRYDEQKAGADSVSSRGGSLFVFVGILTTGATLLAGLATPENPWLLGLIVLFGFCLFYATLAAAFLAIRSQQVSVWKAPSLKLENLGSKRALDVQLAVELMAAVDFNRETHRNLVAYLRDGQVWARLVLFLVVILAAIVVFANATKPMGTAASPATPSAMVAPSPAVATTPGVQKSASPAP
jgi:hypothetical protein